MRQEIENSSRSPHPRETSESDDENSVSSNSNSKFPSRPNSVNGKFENNGVHSISDSEDSQSQQSPKKSRIKNRASLKDNSPELSTKKYSRIKRQRSGSSSDEKSPRREKKRPAMKKYKFKGAEKKVENFSDEEDKWSDRVIESSEEDNSDVEISDDMTHSKQKVFDFLNTATKLELLQVQTCTEKKIVYIFNLRPFTGWKDLVLKFKSGKNLSPEFLNHTVKMLKSRDIVARLMKRCLKLAVSTEKAIIEGSAMLEKQPSIMTDSLQLKSYQMVGLNWLAVMHNQGLNGILADEMGLGKTIQVIAFLSYLKESGFSNCPHLIVVPASTIDNWAIEFTKWSPTLNVVIYHGSADDRKALRYEWAKDKFKSMDVIITTYNIVGSNPEEKKMFRIINLHYVVFDEAHMLKNMNTQRYVNLYNINAKRRILLTGTPLQNTLLELMSLLNFVMPNMFSRCIDHIKAFFSKYRSTADDDISAFEEEQIDLAKRIMKPFVLRRLKDDVLKDLPEKTSTVIFVPLEEEQQEKYDNMLKELKEWAETKEEGFSVLSSFMQLRKLANHPLTCRFHFQEEVLKDIADRLASDETYKETREHFLYEDLCYMSDHDIHKLAKEHTSISKFKLNDKFFLTSGKFKKLDEILPKLKSEGHRVVIFSQFLFILDLLEEYLRIRDHTFVRLDGSTNILDRQELIDNFNEDSDVFVFLLTTKAGGVGINLTSADTVIIHDVDFNPYNDKQAEDRCHRLGQKRPVQIMRFVSQGTVEEKIYACAQSKLELEQGLTNNKEDEEDVGKNVALLLRETLGLKK
ncbi:SWI/SNF-related matrix-associated actin-dependent regulator of chromatin subfamily A containing DEAD/H box 1 homolog isoform X2 [Cimex lectularius]|nr:SWI/SNF-related matrix-associated actin-dependent regulator of chromatin subfamily A containing DEAD/H box 1 homolog isoform X2 [Cimex lectularius]